MIWKIKRENDTSCDLLEKQHGDAGTSFTVGTNEEHLSTIAWLLTCNTKPVFKNTQCLCSYIMIIQNPTDDFTF